MPISSSWVARQVRRPGSAARQLWFFSQQHSVFLCVFLPPIIIQNEDVLDSLNCLYKWKKTILICQRMDESRQPLESGGGVWQVAGRMSTHTSLLQFFAWFFAYYLPFCCFDGRFCWAWTSCDGICPIRPVFNLYGQNKCPSLVPHHN